MIFHQDIKDKIHKLRLLDEELDALGEEVKAKNIEKQKLKGQLTSMLLELNEKNFTCEYGTITKVTDYSVRLPQGEAKQKFFDFLEEQGVFKEMATINYNTINAYYKEKWELAKREDPVGALNFSLPGIGECTAFETIKMTKKRGSK